ncbi:MAG TPA: tetratricopeptide repeat protein [Candidatus Sulfotelmatobacter sp.]
MSRCIGVLPLLLLTMIPVKAQSYGSELNLGVDAYRNSRYEAATQHFRKATELDPNQPVAHL